MINHEYLLCTFLSVVSELPGLNENETETESTDIMSMSHSSGDFSPMGRKAFRGRRIYALPTTTKLILTNFIERNNELRKILLFISTHFGTTCTFCEIWDMAIFWHIIYETLIYVNIKPVFFTFGKMAQSYFWNCANYVINLRLDWSIWNQPCDREHCFSYIFQDKSSFFFQIIISNSNLHNRCNAHCLNYKILQVFNRLYLKTRKMHICLYAKIHST